MPRLADRVKETTDTVGLGSVSLSGIAPAGFQTFASAFGAANTMVGYCIYDPATAAWEVGRGTFNGASASGALLLHGEGTNGSTTITDSSVYANVGTPTGVTVSTAQFKYGAASLAFPGSASSRIDYATSYGLQLGSYDFTWEAFVRLTTIGVLQNIVFWNGNVSGYAAMSLAVSATNRLGISVSESGAAWRVDDTVGSGTALAANQWYHVAVTRQGQTLYTWLDGVMQSSYGAMSSPGASMMTTYTLNQIGAYNTSTRLLSGYLDEARLTIGTAVYTSNFTPPTAAFGSTLLTLDRSIVRSSSAAGAKVNFGSGTKDVFVTASAELLDNSNYGMFLAARGMSLI